MMTDHKRTYSQRGDDYLLEAQRVCGEDKRGQDKPAPRCPYCGKGMEIDTFENYLGWCGQAVCKACKSRGVLKRYHAEQAEAEQAAYAAAMQRWQEPNRVLTLGEIISKVSDAVGGVPVWVEQQELGWAWAGWQVLRGTERCVLMFGPTVGIADTQNINRTWRCWLRKPTRAETEAVPWEKEYAKD